VIALLLAWRPFLDPLDAHDVWYLLLIPLALGISWSYKAVRVRSLDEFWRQMLAMTIQTIVAMIALGLAVFIFVEHLVPMILPIRM